MLPSGRTGGPAPVRMNEAMNDWAHKAAVKSVVGLDSGTVNRVAQALRDERSRAIQWCTMASVHKKAPFHNEWLAGTDDARRDIAAAIKGQPET